MKTTEKTFATERNFNDLISVLTDRSILTISEMICVKGGDGEGSGQEPIIIPPKIT